MARSVHEIVDAGWLVRSPMCWLPSGRLYLMRRERTGGGVLERSTDPSRAIDFFEDKTFERMLKRRRELVVPVSIVLEQGRPRAELSFRQ